LFYFICLNTTAVELKIKKRLVLEGIPSASGIEFYNGHIYITADNSPWLYQLNTKYEVVGQFNIYGKADVQIDTIPKTLKPDFEAMTLVREKEGGVLYIFGSGSKSPHRDVLVRVNADKPSDHSLYSLTAFYKLIKERGAYSDDNFNIEAAAVAGDTMVLMNRATNDLVQFSTKEFIKYLEDSSDISMQFSHFVLPAINGMESRIAGCANITGTDRILFTSSVEDTANWIADGEVLGSFIGISSLKDLSSGVAPPCIQIETGSTGPLKIESIAVISTVSRKITLSMVSDNDEGRSELIEAVLCW
jgi:hypothetical protein